MPRYCAELQPSVSGAIPLMEACLHYVTVTVAFSAHRRLLALRSPFRRYLPLC